MYVPTHFHKAPYSLKTVVCVWGGSLILFPTPEKEEAQSCVLPHRGSHWVTLMKSPNLSGPGFLVIK